MGFKPLNLNLAEVIKNEYPEQCKGLFFRCRVNTYLQQDYTLVEKVSYRPLRRKSCRGCPKCECFWEDHNMTGDFSTYLTPLHPKNGAIYEIIFRPGSPDWETGYVEDWEWDFKEVKEEKP